MNQQPDWLYQITYGLAEGRKTRVLIDGVRFAVVQTPGGKWYDNSGGHPGYVCYYLVDKQRTNLRKGYGLLDCKELQHGGRPKLTQWKKLIENEEKPVEPELVAVPCKGGNGRSCSQDATDNCQHCGKDICPDHIGAEQPDDPAAIICTDCD